MANGTKINGPVELRQELASHPEAFVESLTERLLMYAVNRRIEYFDMPQVRKIARDAKKGQLHVCVAGIGNCEYGCVSARLGLARKESAELSASSIKPPHLPFNIK